MYLKYKIQKYIYVFCILQSTVQWHNGSEFFRTTNDKVQTKVQTLLFVSFIDVQIDKFEVFRFWTQAKVNSRVTADQVLSH